MKKILITYFTESGSTRQAAEMIAEQLNKTNNLEIEIYSCENISNVDEYSLIIIGTPNWYGKPTPKIQEFLKSYRSVLNNTPTAIYFTCMSLAEISGDNFENILIFKDPFFNSTPKPFKDMTMWEKSHAVSYYLKNIQKVVPEFSPTALAFFKGNLNFAKLCFSHRIIMKLITLINKDVNEGNYLSEDAIRKWATSSLNTIL